LDRRNFLKAGFATTVFSSIAGAAYTETAAIQNGRPEHLSTDSVTLFVRDWGNGPPILFLAAWALTSDFWGYQMLAAKGEGFRAIAYDRRGHGRSSDPSRGYDFDCLSDDLARVIREHGLNGVTLVCHSMSSGEVARYFSRHGGHGIERILFVAPTTPFLMKSVDNPGGIPREAMAAGRSLMLPDFPGRISSQIGPFFTPDASAAMVEWVKSMINQTSLLAVTEIAKLMQETDFRPDLAHIHVPTLVIHGDEDKSAPIELTGKRTAALIKNARLKIYEGAPHGIPLTHEMEFHRDLIEFATS
jgi:pimeloyl-ACP methyl ester carboxylesterase